MFNFFNKPPKTVNSPETPAAPRAETLAAVKQKAQELGHGDSFTPEMAHTAAQILEAKGATEDSAAVEQAVDLRMQNAAAAASVGQLKVNEDLTVERPVA